MAPGNKRKPQGARGASETCRDSDKPAATVTPASRGETGIYLGQSCGMNISEEREREREERSRATGEKREEEKDKEEGER